MTLNLTEEYGDLLDYIVDAIDNTDSLNHYGVKGMKWGVRKDLSPRPKLTGLGPSKITVKTKSGAEVTLTKEPPSGIAKLLSKMSRRYTDYVNDGAFLKITDADGKKIGNATVQKKSDDELNLMWLEIDKSQRGQGYATAVMSAAAQFGKDSGFSKLTLEVPGLSPDARHIYDRLGFQVTKEPSARDRLDVWGGLTEMEYVFSEAKHSGVVMTDELAHYGVKGMKWGQRKRDDSPNPRYSAKRRQEDQAIYGRGGVKRINRRMNAGATHNKAQLQEFGLGLGVGVALAAAPIVLSTVASFGGTAIRNAAASSAARRGAEATANAMADSRGLTSYRTIALAFDTASGTWK